MAKSGGGSRGGGGGGAKSGGGGAKSGGSGKAGTQVGGAPQNPNWPSTTGNPSGGGRGNAPPSQPR